MAFRFPDLRQLRLRDITPRGLYARSILIIILPIALLLIAVSYVFFDTHWRQVSSKLSEGVAGDIAFLIQLYEDDPSEFSAIAERAWETTRLSVVIRPGEELPVAERRSFFSVLDRTLQQELSEALDNPFWFDTTRYPGYIDIRVSVGEDYMRVLAYRDRAYATTGHIFLLWIIGASLLLSLIAVIFLRNQVRPILALSDAADAFGRGESVPDFKPAGATEVRRASLSVIRMRDRMRRYADERTAMLAGVSHDLKTPLTRLKLELALLKNQADISAAQADIKEMENMLEGYLAFARGEEGERAADVSVPDIVRAACAAAGDRAAFEFAGETELTIRARPLSLKRAVANLANNAADHAENVRVTVTSDDDRATITVEDDGPGIPSNLIEEALRPFGRLDASRNQNASGVGLGLPIARDIARAHGGSLRLEKSELGGLKAVLLLPRRSRSAR